VVAVASVVHEQIAPQVSLQLAENVLRRRHLELTLLLDINELGNAILHDDCEALATSAHAEATRIQLEAQRLGVFTIAVGQHLDLEDFPQALITNTSLTAMQAIVSTPFA
jgi:hypothetical protein